MGGRGGGGEREREREGRDFGKVCLELTCGISSIVKRLGDGGERGKPSASAILTLSHQEYQHDQTNMRENTK